MPLAALAGAAYGPAPPRFRQLAGLVAGAHGAALALIRVDYEELPAVFEAEDAIRDGAPLVHDDVTALNARSAYAPCSNTRRTTASAQPRAVLTAAGRAANRSRPSRVFLRA